MLQGSTIGKQEAEMEKTDDQCYPMLHLYREPRRKGKAMVSSGNQW